VPGAGAGSIAIGPALRPRGPIRAIGAAAGVG
jgi:hypothetical protein